MAAVGPDGAVAYPGHLNKMYPANRRFEDKDLFLGNFPISKAASQFASQFPDEHLRTRDIFSRMITGKLVHTSTVMITRERRNLVKRFNEDFKLSWEDYDFHLRTCREGQLGFVNVASIRYQIGRPDQLTHWAFGVHIARDFLNIIEPVMEKDRRRIDLQKSRLDGTLAYAHCWLGEELLQTGSFVEARSQLAESLRKQWSIKPAALYARTVLPAGCVPILREIEGSAYRAALSWFLSVPAARFSKRDGGIDT